MVSLEVLAKHCLAGDGLCNEDLIGTAPGAAWVIDGATGLGTSLLPHTTDAAWFVEAFDAALRVAIEDASEEATTELLRRATEGVAARFAAEQSRAPGEPHELPSAAFAMVRVCGERLELSVLGDCRIIHAESGQAAAVFGAEGVGRFEAATLAELAALYAADPALEVAAAKEFILPRLRANRAHMNREDGYWVLGLDVHAIDHLASTTLVPASGQVELALASDGFLRLDDLFALATPAAMLAATGEAEVEALFDRLRAAEADDAGCRRHVRAKCRDDASLLRARFTA